MSIGANSVIEDMEQCAYKLIAYGEEATIEAIGEVLCMPSETQERSAPSPYLHNNSITMASLRISSL